MSYGVEFTAEAVDDLSRLDKAVIQRILKKIGWLADSFDRLTPEPLVRELKGLFKLRVGGYRVIYSVSQKERLVTIHLVGHRKDIYK